MKIQLEVGDTVYLRSGGPLMTVYDITNPELVVCQWFRECNNFILEKGGFPPKSLKFLPVGEDVTKHPLALAQFQALRE